MRPISVKAKDANRRVQDVPGEIAEKKTGFDQEARTRPIDYIGRLRVHVFMTDAMFQRQLTKALVWDRKRFAITARRHQEEGTIATLPRTHTVAGGVRSLLQRP